RAVPPSQDSRRSWTASSRSACLRSLAALRPTALRIDGGSGSSRRASQLTTLFLAPGTVRSTWRAAEYGVTSRGDGRRGTTAGGGPAAGREAGRGRGRADGREA